MILPLLSLLIGFLCLFLVLLMLVNPIKNYKRNVYLIIIFLFAGLNRFFNGIELLDIATIPYIPLKNKPVFVFYIVSVYYLFFSRLTNPDSANKKELLHFIFPVLLTVLNVWIVNFKYFGLVFLGYCIVYLALSFLKIKAFLYKESKTILGQMSNPALKTWLLLMFSVCILSMIYSNTILWIDSDPELIVSTYLKYSSLFWLIALFYLFTNPVIIFGESYLIKNSQKIQPKATSIWNTKPLKAVDESDRKLYDSISENIALLLLDIQRLQKDVSIISKTTLSPKTIAEELKIPKKHIDLVFKYFCIYSVNDFSNFVKIDYALTLINQGFLKEYTVEALGEKCLFNSRYTFSQNFKKFVGASVTDYSSAVVGAIH